VELPDHILFSERGVRAPQPVCLRVDPVLVFLHSRFGGGLAAVAAVLFYVKID
jgi:hypothetical protein